MNLSGLISEDHYKITFPSSEYINFKKFWTEKIRTKNFRTKSFRRFIVEFRTSRKEMFLLYNLLYNFQNVTCFEDLQSSS